MHFIFALLGLLFYGAHKVTKRRPARDWHRQLNPPGIVYRAPRKRQDQSDLVGTKSVWKRKGYASHFADVDQPCPDPGCNNAKTRIVCSCLQCGGMGHGWRTRYLRENPETKIEPTLGGNYEPESCNDQLHSG